MQRYISTFPSIEATNLPGRLLALLAVWMLASPVRAATDVDARLAVTAEAIEQALDRSDVPGLVIGVTDRQGLRKVIVHGYADLKTRKPLTADSRFAIGSISKAFTAIALLQLAQENRFDLHAPITRYLPSLVIHSRFAPITGHHLLAHTAGLPNYLPDSASSRFAAVELRNFEPTYAPGAHWWYSNTGYQLLGYVLENIEHAAYSTVLRHRVLEPLGMTSTSAIIDDAQRNRLVVSYVRWPYDGEFVEAPWFEYSAGDGSLVADVADMSSYVRFILNAGMGSKVRVLSESSFTLLTTPVLDNYAYGLRVRQEGGHTVIGHTGSIGGFHAAVEAHVDEGFGLVLLANAAIDSPLKSWIVSALTAACEGGSLPPLPASAAQPVRSDLHEYAGRFRPAGRDGVDSNAAALTFVVSDDRLFLVSEHGNIVLEAMGNDLFRVAADAPGMLPFAFGRGGPDDKGKVSGVSQGARWFAADGFPARLLPSVEHQYVSYVGHFMSNGPEGPVARVFVRNGKLMMLLSEDEAATPQPLEPLGRGLFRIGKEAYSPERARFDTWVEGQALRLFISGVPLYRKDIP
jgi:D-alanyl-D-alanine carboxypeptidase